jgi:hypothetical protein
MTFFKVHSIQMKVDPVHRIYINSLYYITYSMLEQVLEMTSNSQTCLTPGEQMIENRRSFLD